MILAILQTLLLTLGIINLSSAATYSDLDSLASSSSLKCYVCNSKVGGCDPVPEFQKDCKDYLGIAYGVPKSPAGIDIEKYPQGLSELTDETLEDKDLGWHHGGFPGLYKKPPGSPAAGPNPTDAYRTSSLSHLYNQGKLDDGFATCRVMYISVNNQQNGAVRQEIPYANKRIIRSCSFIKKSDLTGFNANGCKQFKFKTAIMDVCYCDSDNCNGSSYMRVSYWMIAASFFVILAQFAMQKI